MELQQVFKTECSQLTYVQDKNIINNTVNASKKIGRDTMFNQFYKILQQHGSAPANNTQKNTPKQNVQNNAKTPLPSLSLPLNITDLPDDILRNILDKASRMNYNTNLVNKCLTNNLQNNLQHNFSKLMYILLNELALLQVDSSIVLKYTDYYGISNTGTVTDTNFLLITLYKYNDDDLKLQIHIYFKKKHYQQWNEAESKLFKFTEFNNIKSNEIINNLLTNLNNKYNDDEKAVLFENINLFMNNLSDVIIESENPELEIASILYLDGKYVINKVETVEIVGDQIKDAPKYVLNFKDAKDIFQDVGKENFTRTFLARLRTLKVSKQEYTQLQTNLYTSILFLKGLSKVKNTTPKKKLTLRFIISYYKTVLEIIKTAKLIENVNPNPTNNNNGSSSNGSSSSNPHTPTLSKRISELTPTELIEELDRLTSTHTRSQRRHGAQDDAQDAQDGGRKRLNWRLMTLSTLYKMAQEYNIANRSKMTKNELMASVKRLYEQNKK